MTQNARTPAYILERFRRCRRFLYHAHASVTGKKIMAMTSQNVRRSSLSKIAIVVIPPEMPGH